MSVLILRVVNSPSNRVAFCTLLVLGLCSHDANAQRSRGPRGVRRPRTTQTTVVVPPSTLALPSSQPVPVSAGPSTQPEPATNGPVSETPAVTVGSEEPLHPPPWLAALDVNVGMRWVSRLFSYHQDLFGELRDYTLAAAPMLTAGVEWYPGAHFTRKAGALFGLVASGAYVFAVSSQDSLGTQYGTTAFSFDVGIRGRLLLGPHELGVQVTYGQQRFALDNRGGGGPMMGDPGVPAVAYQHIRPGMNARIALGERFGLHVGASGLVVLSAGEITEQYFSRASVYGLEAQLGFSVKLSAGLEVRAVAEARRYIFAMSPMVQDRWVAGGALDHYLNAGVVIAFRR